MMEIKLSAPDVEHRCHLEQGTGYVRTRSVCLCGSKSAWYTLPRHAVEAGTDHMNAAHR